MIDSLDERFIAAAIRLGASANGTTWPNPAVGAILVADGTVIARGQTARGGRPHGEAAALAAAGEKARGATMYVSLEPCAHQSQRGGACADAIIEAGVARVVAAMTDPDPRTAGQGFERLRQAGIAVASGVLEAQARHAHAAHLRRFDSLLPYVALKLAISADDGIGRMGEGQVAVTGEIARRHVHALRARFDAIMVGRGTVEADDPQLIVRLPGLEARSPVRVVLDTEGRLPVDCRIFVDSVAPTWVIGTKRNPRLPDRIEQIDGVRSSLGGLDPWTSLGRLREKGITRVMVEGGAKLARRLLESDLINEAIIFRSREALGGKIVPALDGLPLAMIENAQRFERIERRRFGSDMMSRYERVR